MKKKLTLLYVALLAVAAFAIQSKRAASALIDYPTSQSGITLYTLGTDGGVQFSEVAVKGTTVPAIEFGKSIKNTETEKYYAELSVEGGFKKGDVITIKGCYSHNDPKETTVVFYGADLATKIWTPDNFINVKDGENEPTEQTYTLETDAEKLYCGRSDGTKTYITLLTITRNSEDIIPVDVVVEAADITGGKITDAIAAKAAGNPINNLTINLAENGAYTISESITAGGNIAINGNGASVDASALEGNFIEMAVIENPTEWTEANVTVKGVTVKGLKKAMFYSACKNYFGDVVIDNCVVELAADATTFDYTKGSTAVNFTVTNSTFYAPTATTKSFYSSQSGQKTTEYNADAVQTFKFENNTMYNLIPGKNFFSHRQSNQTWMAYDVQNNIFVNCGKSGQVIKGMNGGQGGKNPTWTVKGNVFNFEADGVMTDTSAAEDTGDTTEGEGVQNSIAGVITFEDAANGKFNGTLAVDEPVASVPGDPRWTVTAKVNTVDVVVEAADITDGKLTDAIATKSGGKRIKNLTVNLAENGAYTLSGSIVACGNITINGNGATVTAPDAANFIEMVAIENPTEWTEANVTVKGVTVKGLKKAMFYSACKNYFGDVVIDNCVVELAADATTFDYTKGSTAVNFTVTNSTFYAPTATTKSFYSSQSGQKTTEYNADAVQTFKFENNTMYNLIPGKNFFSHRQSNQKWLKYVVKDNIFVDCGKSGQVIKGMNGGQGGANPVWDIDGNIFNFGGADTSAAEDTGDADEPVKNSIEGVVKFADAANGDFNGKFVLAPETTAPETMPGDPRWTLTAVTAYTITVVNADGITITPEVAYAAEGEKVYATYTLEAGYELEFPDFVDDDNNPIAFEEGSTIGLETVGGVEKMWIIMPAKNVTIKAKASKVFVITLDLPADNTMGDVVGVNVNFEESPITKKSGEIVYLNITPKDGYEIASVTVTGADETSIPVTEEAGTYKGQEYTHYFEMPAQSVTLKVTFQVATGINAISVDGVAGDIFSDGKPVYNLSGQRVFKGYKGIVIKNGKKVVIK